MKIPYSAYLESANIEVVREVLNSSSLPDSLKKVNLSTCSAKQLARIKAELVNWLESQELTIY
jgi:hypothetical protein